MKRYGTSPWVAPAAGIVSALIAGWFTDSLLFSVLIAVVVGLFCAGTVAVLGHRGPTRDF